MTHRAFFVLGGLALVSAAQLVFAAPPLARTANPPVQPIAPAGKQPIPSLGLPPPPDVSADYVDASTFWPELGENVTFKLRLKNNATTPAKNIPWSIHDATHNKTLMEGVVPEIAPNSTVIVGPTTWAPFPGETLIQGYVDPQGKTKNKAQRQVHETRLKVAQPGKFFVRVGLAGMGKGTVHYNLPGSPRCSNSPDPQVGTPVPSTCFMEITANDEVHLQAFPSQNSNWGGWSVGCARKQGPDANGRDICIMKSVPHAVVSAAFIPK